MIVPQKPSNPLLAANRRQHAGPFVLLGGEQQEAVLSLYVFSRNTRGRFVSCAVNSDEALECSQAQDAILLSVFSGR